MEVRWNSKYLMLNVLAILLEEVIHVVPHQHEPPADVTQAIVILFVGILLFYIIRTVVFKFLGSLSSLSTATFIRKICGQKHISFLTFHIQDIS
jgi:hypothetical protein